MELHQAKAAHAAKKLSAKHAHHQHPLTRHNHPAMVDTATPYGGNVPVVGTHTNQPVGATATMAGTTAPTYPLGGHPPHKYA